MTRALSILCAVLFAWACSGEVELVRPPVTEVLEQNPPTQVDILLVIDDSCSMADEQERLGEGFHDFVDFFDVADIDYHIGVTTTDWDVNHGRLVDAGGAIYIDRDTPNPDEVFRQNVQVGTDGAGTERAFDSVLAALQPPIVDGPNAGFFRPAALLSVIFVSDEEEASEGPVSSFVNTFRDIKGHRRRDAFNASALAGLDPQSGLPDFCTSADSELASSPGWRYWDIAVQTGGVASSICEGDFGDIVRQMGLASSRLKDRFHLERRPIAGTVEVTLFLPDQPGLEEEGLPVPPEGIEGVYSWVYEEQAEEELYWIRFTDLAHLPPVDTRVVVRYERL